LVGGAHFLAGPGEGGDFSIGGTPVTAKQHTRWWADVQDARSRGFTHPSAVALHNFKKRLTTILFPAAFSLLFALSFNRLPEFLVVSHTALGCFGICRIKNRSEIVEETSTRFSAINLFL